MGMQDLLQSGPGASGQGVCVERGDRPEGCDALQAGHSQESSGRLQQVANQSSRPANQRGVPSGELN